MKRWGKEGGAGFGVQEAKMSVKEVLVQRRGDRQVHEKRKPHKHILLIMTPCHAGR